jgi:two-component system, sensor histidine kinase and response regulator
MAALAVLAPDAPTESSGGFVLVADDNEINRTAVLALLAQRNLHAAVAHDGGEAVEMARRDHYDAILMDCVMPQVDGFQATRRIRAAETGRHVPIIALTALRMPGDRERCLQAGMDDYLGKPLLGPALDAALDRWLPHPAPFQLSADEDVLDQAAVLQLRDTLTPALRAHLIELFEAQQEQCVIEISASLQCGDRDAVRRAAHLLKGSSATLGAVKLCAFCQELEHMSRSTDGDLSQERLDRFCVTAAEASLALRRRLLGVTGPRTAESPPPQAATASSGGIPRWPTRTTR